MSVKYWVRTFRNVAFRDRPYFAQLAITHRCNLRCRFCRIWEEEYDELDTEGVKRVIDVFDRLGVAVVSISGGEPLLRPDLATILDYADGKGLSTRVSTNGTMPLDRYGELLKSGIQEINLSVDGVRGNDLPHSHIGPQILKTIRYLNDNLPPKKRLTLSVTVSQANQDQVEDIVDFCAKEYPKAGIWLKPVTVGVGKLRTATEEKVHPEFLRRCKSRALLYLEYFNQAVEDYYNADIYDWGCRAGRTFFEVKPNGDFWLCNDVPSRTPLNVLDPDFKSKWREADFSYRRECSGCVYSCYIITQKGFESRNWDQLAILWWLANTKPDERCRAIAEEEGWIRGFLSFCVDRTLGSFGRRKKPAAAS